jgi:lipopolysaccharide/colanic/teichoic acid biosynthesis glycosyltransferase
MNNALETLGDGIFSLKGKAVTQSVQKRVYVAFKRLFDILASFFGMLFLSPLFLYVAIRIKKDSPGPVFFKGSRAGKNGREFKVIKFRTMYELPESYHGSRITADDDKRITSFGKWLSDTKFNELPQLWNVLKGEMSFVGPRPEDYEIAMQWPEEIRAEVLSVRPGITSPASVIYRDEKKLLQGTSVMDDYLRKILPEKQRLDQLYVRQQSLMGDLDVIFMTLILLLPGLRKVRPNESTLYSGMFS